MGILWVFLFILSPLLFWGKLRGSGMGKNDDEKCKRGLGDLQILLCVVGIAVAAVLWIQTGLYRLGKRMDRIALKLDDVVGTLPEKSQVALRLKFENIDKDVAMRNSDSAYQEIAVTPLTNAREIKAHAKVEYHKKRHESEAAQAPISRP